MTRKRLQIAPGQPPSVMLIFSSLTVIIVGLLFQLAGLFLATAIYGTSAAELTQVSGAESRNVLNAMKFLQIIGAMGTFIFSSMIVSYFYTGKWMGYFPFRTKMNLASVIVIIMIMISALPFVNFVTDLNYSIKLPFDQVESYLRNLEEQTESLMMTLLKGENLGQLLVNLFMIAVIPAIGEELVFRGLIQRHLTDMFRNPHIAIILASVVFSLAHFQFYSFLPRFFLGIILGYSFYYGRSLWYPVIAHFVNNSLGVIFYFFYSGIESAESLEEIGTMEKMPAIALISAIVVIMLMWMWTRMMKLSQPPRSAD